VVPFDVFHSIVVIADLQQPVKDERPVRVLQHGKRHDWVPN
jgi:hypothetical protein